MLFQRSLALPVYEHLSAAHGTLNAMMENSPQAVVAYIVSQELAKISSLLPSNRQRSSIVHSLISTMNLMKPDFAEKKRLQVVNPRRATYKDIAMYHTRDYLDFVLDPENSNQMNAPIENAVTGEFGLEDDCPVFPGLPDYVQLIAGATLTAVAALKKGVADTSICWDGGRHHAQKSRASGYCYVADCVLAIMELKRSSPASGSIPLPNSMQRPRVMYLDLDLHFSDAVSDAFYQLNSSGMRRTLTLSIHHADTGFYPASPRTWLPDVTDPAYDPFTLSIPLQQGASRSTYARIWPIVERVKDAFKPDFVVVQCGTDALAGDPCATFNWTLGGSGSLGWCIQQIVERWDGRKLFLGGGGYHSANAARAWAYLTSIILGNPIDLDADIPDHAGFPLYHPAFTLDVPVGNMPDRNTDEYLTTVETTFEEVIETLNERFNNQF